MRVAINKNLFSLDLISQVSKICKFAKSDREVLFERCSGDDAVAFRKSLNSLNEWREV